MVSNLQATEVTRKLNMDHSFKRFREIL